MRNIVVRLPDWISAAVRRLRLWLSAGKTRSAVRQEGSRFAVTRSVAKACAGLGVVMGSVFATAASAAPTAPSGLNTISLKATSFTLRWSAATGGTGGIAGYDVYRDGTQVGSTTTARTFAVTSLAPTTTYSMTVVARDGLGNASPASSVLAVTTPADTTNPSRPTDLAASSVTTISFTLSWTGSTDDVGVTGYNVYNASTLLGSTSATTFDVSGLTPDVNNRMTVRAMDAAGNLSGVSVALVVHTLADPPSSASGLNVTALKPASFTLKWIAATGGTGGIANYDVYLNGVLAGTTTKKTFAFAGLTPVTAYSLTVASRDTAGNVSPQSAALAVTTPADTTKPTVPKNLSALAVTHNSFTLTWQPSTDNVGVTGYDILRNNVAIGSSATNSFNVTGVAPVTAYSMKVKAKDAAGNITNASAALTVTTSVVPNAHPAVILTVPTDGASYTAPATITLTATATDSDGTVTKVEFFEGSNKLGEALTPSTPPATFTLPFTFTDVGAHVLTARATDNGNSTTDSAPATFQALSGLPYVSSFEAAEGFTPGSLDGQRGWSVAAGSAQVTAMDASTGEQSIVLNAGATVALVDKEFGAGATNPAVVFFDLYAKPVAGADIASGTVFDLDNARLVFVLNGDSGRFLALDGDGAGSGTWKPLSPLLPLAAGNITPGWQRITVRFDYTTRKWDAYLNGQLLAANLGFRFDSATFLSGISFQGQTTAGAELDDLYAGEDNPLFIDADKDGMEDAWETAHGLSPALNDRNGDPDGDGLTNIQEYVLGTNPNAADSDSDGLNDGQEVAVGTNPLVADTDGDGLPDGWEQSHNLNPLIAGDATADADGDGLTNQQEFQAGSDPNDYYNGEAPQLTIVSGNNQAAAPGQFNAQPFVVSVMNHAGTAPLANAPVTFTVESGGGKLAASTTESPPPGSTLTVVTDEDGLAQMYYRQPFTADTLGSVLVSAGSAQVSFVTTSGAPTGIDADHNGISDLWEQQHFGQTGVDPNADPDGDGFTNLQEFQGGSDPNDMFDGKDLVVIPQLTEFGELLPGGKFRVWVGRSDGVPLRNATVVVTMIDTNNVLTDAGGTGTSQAVTLHTDANGFAEAYLTPNTAPPSNGS